MTPYYEKIAPAPAEEDDIATVNLPPRTHAALISELQLSARGGLLEIAMIEEDVDQRIRNQIEELLDKAA